MSGFFIRPTESNRLFFLLTLLVGVAALYLRMSGIFRGLGPEGKAFHPDEAKQVLALYNFLNGIYTRTYDSIFYDGYPYGLNHLDEFLLRPVLCFLGATPVDQADLFYFARTLRIIYGLTAMGMTAVIVFRLTARRFASLAAMLVLALSPLAVTVTHFATGDVGVDLFTAACLLFTLLYLEHPGKKHWLLASGFAVGAAFSAKYNGMLTGMVPAVAICALHIPDRLFRRFVLHCCLFSVGLLCGVLVFTPQLLLDFSTSSRDILANFAFIKNYRVPAEISALPGIPRALAGLRDNSPKIIAALGSGLFAATVLRLIFTGMQLVGRKPVGPEICRNKNIFILSVSLFPLAALVIALAGKYVVQPFHFSSLQVPMVIALCTLLTPGWRLVHQRNPSTGALVSCPFASKKQQPWLRATGLLLLVFTLVSFGRISLQGNFFWRRDDTASYVHALPGSIYTREAVQTRPGGVIRSLFLEEDTYSVFRNFYTRATGPDAELWKTIHVAPLPQVVNPTPFNWIFLNGPTFPVNERILFLRGEGCGKRVTRDLVLPAGQELPVFGVRSGSYPTSVTLDFGGAGATVHLEAHQQKTITLTPRTWRTSRGIVLEEEVRIIPLTVSVPHNDASVTILLTPSELNLFNLFGGSGQGTVTAPSPFPPGVEKSLVTALSSVRYLEAEFNQNIQAGVRFPFWEVLLPAGRYTADIEVRGIGDSARVKIFLEDANGKSPGSAPQIFSPERGKQVLKYHFTKPFAPYQGRLVLQVLSGEVNLLSGHIVPDHEKLFRDFDRWRRTGTRPDWVARY
jgi:hypothetical protein